jgi:hypothetical protein
MLNVVAVHHVRDYVLWLRFNDGSEGEVDLRDELSDPVFEPLRDVRLFSQVSLNPDLRTICWPNAADFAPEFLYEQAVSVRVA